MPQKHKATAAKELVFDDTSLEPETYHPSPSSEPAMKGVLPTQQAKKRKKSESKGDRVSKKNKDGVSTNTRNRPWTEQEKITLIGIIEKYGDNPDWNVVTQEYNLAMGRTKHQIR
ncbi:hypothetical protein HDV00_002505 [Rhizophlyctis rosea]|nr:hypothetical protein HDV00_002505 [Rhizophlyctis rosea]